MWFGCRSAPKGVVAAQSSYCCYEVAAEPSNRFADVAGAEGRAAELAGHIVTSVKEPPRPSPSRRELRVSVAVPPDRDLNGKSIFRP